MFFFIFFINEAFLGILNQSLCSNSSKSIALKCQRGHREQNQEWILKKRNPVTIHT